jgi:hypothetical protein
LKIIIGLLALSIIAVGYFGFIPKETVIEIEEVKEEEIIKTLDSEIDRLSIKYGVASSTVRAISVCESSMYGSALNKNYRTITSVVDGVATTTQVHWSTDYGIMQVNDYYHKDTMIKLGWNIYDEYDSLEYGIMLLSRDGTRHWKASQYCWSKKI